MHAIVKMKTSLFSTGSDSVLVLAESALEIEGYSFSQCSLAVLSMLRRMCTNNSFCCGILKPHRFIRYLLSMSRFLVMRAGRGAVAYLHPDKMQR